MLKRVAVFILILASSGLAHAQRRVQITGKDAGTTLSATFTFPSNVTAGDLLIAFYRGGCSGEAVTVSDTLGTKYQAAAQVNDQASGCAGDTLAIYYGVAPSSGADTVTISQTISATLRAIISEYSGMAVSGGMAVLDKSSVGNGTGMSPLSSSVSTTQSPELLLSAAEVQGVNTFTPGANWTLVNAVPGAPNSKIAYEEQIVNATGIYTGSWNLVSSGIWATATVAFVAGPPPVTITTKFTYDDGTAVAGSVQLYKLQTSGAQQQIANVVLDSTGKAAASIVLDPTAQYRGVLVGLNNTVLQQVWTVPLNQVLNQSVISTLAAGQVNVIIAKADNSIKNVSFTSQ